MTRLFTQFTALPLMALPLLAACSSFDTDYTQKVAANDAPYPVAGAWVGRWQSTQGHGGGDLRAIITPVDPANPAAIAADRTYAGRFRAKWGFFTSEYEAKVSARADMRRMSTFTVHVEADLGFFAGGRYTMDGESTPGTFTATYKANGDEGTIELVRDGTPSGAGK